MAEYLFGGCYILHSILGVSADESMLLSGRNGL